MASLPLKIYTHAPGGYQGVAIRYNGPSIFDRPSANANLYDWIYQCMTSLLLWGNAWGLITGRDGYGFPTGIEWIPPDMIEVMDDPQQPWNPMRTRVFVYGRQVENWREELYHIRAMALAGRTEGISPLRAFASTVMHGLEAGNYGVDWFLNGGFPPGIFQNRDIEIDAEAAAEIRETLVSSIRAHQPLVIGADWDYKPIVVPPSEAQFVEATQMNATQMAAVYGLPPDRVGGKRGDSLTYNTVEQSTLQVIEALRPWIVRLENAFFDLIPANRYVRFNADALLKTDLKTRTEIYMQQRAMGMLTIDEIRDQEDRPPYPESTGDEKIPLEVMVAMSRSIRGIPKSMLPSVELEVDLITDRLEELQKQGLTAPDSGPGVTNPDSFLGNQIGTVRSRPQGDAAAKRVLSLLASGGLDGIDMDDLLAAALEKKRQQEKEAGPQFVGPWIPDRAWNEETGAWADMKRSASGDDDENPAAGPMPAPASTDPVPVRHDPAMYTAHRIDEAHRNIAHATERIKAARTAPAGSDERAYETEHVLTDLGEAHSSVNRLASNIRQNYPPEAKEMDRINKAILVDGGQHRTISVSPDHRATSTAHLIQTLGYHLGHAIRHAQVMQSENDQPAMYNFDAEHCATHAGGALEHIRKLSDHIRDNYPDEARWLAGLQKLAGSGANGNGNGKNLCRRQERKTQMSELSSAAENDLPDSAFAYIEPGGTKDSSGKTTPRSKRHFPVHDEAHARNALSRAPQSPFGKQAMPKIMAAARKFGINVSGSQRSAFGEADAAISGSYPERRFTRFPLEVRTEANGSGPKHIFGYAACFNKLSRKLGGFVEQVSTTAFNESRMSNWPDVVCRYNHKDDMLLGTTYARTLDLHLDDTGLAYDVIPPQSRADILEYVDRGDVRHSSFAFRVFPGGDEWGVSEFNYPMRTLLSVQLVDVAPVLDPAYPDSTSAARAIDGAVESLANWVQGDPDEVRTRLTEGRAMEFFRRTDNAGPRQVTKAPPKPVLSGAQAMLALQANMEDPYTDEG